MVGVTVGVDVRVSSRTPPAWSCSLILLMMLSCCDKYHHHHTADMDLKGKVALFPEGKTTVDIVDIAIGKVVRQHKVEGTIGFSAYVQRNIAAITVFKPYHGVHVLDIKSGKVLCKFVLPMGYGARVTLSKDATALVVGSNSGFL
jgi:hypothetical protein